MELGRAWASSRIEIGIGTEAKNGRGVVVDYVVVVVEAGLSVATALDSRQRIYP